MAINHDAAEDIFKIGLKDGTYTQSEYNQKIQILNTAKASNEALKIAQQDNGIELDMNNKNQFMFLIAQPKGL